VTETDEKMQLSVWKELAVNKQILIKAATDILKLDPNCSPQEFKAALKETIKRTADAELEVSKVQEQAAGTIAALEKKLADSKKALDSVQPELAAAQANQEKLQQQLLDDRNNSAQQLKKLKENLAEKERALKAISTALSDTPENVLKKLKALKKQKMDESDARKKAEEALSTLRKEKQKLELSLKELQAAQEKPEENQTA
jgi:colicin import membrane protein